MSVLFALLRGHLPDGWTASIVRTYSMEQLRYITRFDIRSAPDILGRVAHGMVYVDEFARLEACSQCHDEVKHVILTELCRMDAELIHELALCPDEGQPPVMEDT